MDRRKFLKVSAASGAGALAAAQLPTTLLASAASLDPGPFQYGVASGDPLPDRVIIWTRVTPDPTATPGSGRGKDVATSFQVATDPRFRNVIRSGTRIARKGSDHTVKVDVTKLSPGRSYYYRFKALGARSITGHMRTAPSHEEDNASVRFAVTSCSNWEGGFFSAYRHMAERDDLDFVIHLGDYIYEYGPGRYGPGPEIGRTHEPDHEIVSLADYRIRHAQYKTDPDLRALHAANPFITIWDDHEVTNDTYKDGAENHQPDEEGDFFERRARAYQAYFEWMPVRPRNNPTRLFRRFRFGQLADLHMLDLRQYRDEPVANGQDPAKDDPERTITGDRQMEWLKKGLAKPAARWRLIGNQVMVIPWESGEDQPFNVDAWDGYRPDRQELLQHFVDNEINNISWLTGDIHTSWASDVPIDATTYPVTPSVCTEFVCPSVTSDNLDEITGNPYRTSSIAFEEAIKADNPHVKLVELDSHGYCIADLTKERMQVDWYYISDRTDPEATSEFAVAYQSVDGSNSVTEVSDPIPPDRPT
jgi:alkaline phosphatase D